MTKIAGVIRTEQNWIGGNGYTPIGAAFIPPPPDEVPRLLDDLCRFCNDDGLPAVAQAGIAHAQFETIHPFADGNGRTGRALIYMVLRKRGLAVNATPPISLVLATRSKEYIRFLDATRFIGSVQSPMGVDVMNQWIEFFSTACTRAVADAESFEQRVEAIQAQWRLRLPALRSDAAARILIERLPETPIVTVQGAAKLIGRTFAAANIGIQVLVEAGILVPTKSSSRSRAFEAKEIIDALTLLERQLSIPEGNTRLSKPKRRVPARPVPRE